MKDNGVLRTSSSGAIRNSDVGKVNYQGALSPLVLTAYGKYIQKHSLLPDGTIRNNKNWQKLFGTPEEHRQVCIESAWRHFIDLLMEHDGYQSRDGIEEALGGLFFNISAYWFSLEKEKIEKEKLQEQEKRINDLENYVSDEVVLDKEGGHTLATMLNGEPINITIVDKCGSGYTLTGKQLKELMNQFWGKEKQDKKER